MKKTAMHESFIIAIILSFSGGYINAHTYISLDGVFAFAETGNIILMCVEIARANYTKAFSYFIPISVFFIGCFLTETVKSKFDNKDFIRYEHIILIFVVVILFLIGIFYKDIHRFLSIVIITFVSSVQMSSFRKVGNMQYAANMMTGNIRSAGEELSSFVSNKDLKSKKRFLKYISIIFIFSFGALLGIIFTKMFSGRAIWFCSLLILIAEIIIYVGQKKSFKNN